MSFDQQNSSVWKLDHCRCGFSTQLHYVMLPAVSGASYNLGCIELLELVQALIG
jgi:hypothetical protein